MVKAPDAIEAGPIDLRRWSAEVIDELMDVLERSQPELARWLPWADPMPSRAAELEAIATAVRDFDQGVKFHYFSFERGSGELVGAASLFPTERDPTIREIGYWVRTDRTGRGYATAAARALTDIAFGALELPAVDIRMDRANLASAAVPPRLGYVLLGGEDRDRSAAGHTGGVYIWRKTRHMHELDAPPDA